MKPDEKVSISTLNFSRELAEQMHLSVKKNKAAAADKSKKQKSRRKK